MKKPDEAHTIVLMTPGQMMEMLEDFTDGLMERMKDTTPGLVNEKQMEDATERIMNMFAELDIPPQVAIIMALKVATTMYNVAAIMTGPPCPPSRLN